MIAAYLVVALAILLGGVILLVALAPRLLDTVYYHGPESDHFDGERFFNPDDRRLDGTPPQQRRFSVFRLARFAFGLDREAWPKQVPVTQTVPPPRIEGEALRVTWIGHSSVLVQTQGLNILTDPVWAERASPFAFAGPRRARAPGVVFADLPPIDIVLLSHNHYDHLDRATLGRLWARDRPTIVVPLGTDAILATSGIDAVAGDWGDRLTVRSGIDVVVERVHHWTSRRGADRNRALWCGFTLVLPGGNLFFAGDTGMGDGRWIETVAGHGPIRLALIPVGAYRPRALMAPAHIDPDEATTIFARIGAAYGLAIHWGTFQLSEEGIDDPPARLAEEMAAAGIAPDRFRAPEAGVAWDVPAH